MTITPYTSASSDDGYSGRVETDSTAVSETAIPYEEFKSILKQKMGDLEAGKLKLALKYTATFDISGDTKYKITYNEEVYDITEVERFYLRSTLIAYIISISKRFD